MKFRLPRLNIIQQFIAYLMFLSIIPLMVVGMTSYQISSNLLQEEASLYTTELVADQRDYLDLQLQQVESLLANISGVEEITNALDANETTADTYTSLTTQARIGYILNGYSNLNGLVSIDIFTLGGAHYHVGDTLNVAKLRPEVKDQIFVKTVKANQLVLWTGIEDNVNASSRHKKVITAAKVLSRLDRETLQQKPVALFLVNYSVDYLYDHFIRVNLGQDAFLMIVDAEGRIIFHPDKGLIGSRMDPALKQELATYPENWVRSFNRDDMAINHTHSAMSGWTIVSFIPLKTLTAKTSVIRWTSFLVLLSCFAVVTLVAWLYSRNVVAPIREITRQFKLSQEGSLEWQSRLRAVGQDEIGELVQWFNTFMDSLKARQASEQALRESEERYALAVGGAMDGLWDWDLTHNEIYLSPRWKAMLGHEEQEISNRPDEWFDRVHPEEREQVNAEIATHLKGITSHFESEHRLLHKDGGYRWVIARGLAVSDERGIAARMAGSHTEITDRKRVEEQIKTSLQEKEVLLKEIHHRVKNNLQVISSLLYLQSKSIEDEQVVETFKESQNRVKSMALIHEKLYRSKNLARIDFAEYVRNLVGHLHYSYSTQAERVNLGIDIADIWLDIDTAILCGLIINELISNAFKYAFPGATAPADDESREIWINLRAEQDELSSSGSKLTLTVSDNGIGFPTEVDFWDTPSLGLQLVNNLVDQLDGTVQLVRQNGTEFKIEFRAETPLQKE